jgi:hypothetical protein
VGKRSTDPGARVSEARAMKLETSAARANCQRAEGPADRDQALRAPTRSYSASTSSASAVRGVEMNGVGAPGVSWGGGGGGSKPSGGVTSISEYR